MTNRQGSKGKQRAKAASSAGSSSRSAGQAAPPDTSTSSADRNPIVTVATTSDDQRASRAIATRGGQPGSSGRASDHDVERHASANSANRVAVIVPSTTVTSPLDFVHHWTSTNARSVLDMLLAMLRVVWPDTTEADEKEVRRQWEEGGIEACFMAIESHLGRVEEHISKDSKYKEENLVIVKLYRTRLEQMRVTTQKNLLDLIRAANGWFSWRGVKQSVDNRRSAIKNEMLNDISAVPPVFSKSIKQLEDKYEITKINTGAAEPRLIDVPGESAEEIELRLKKQLTEAVAKSIDATPEQAEKLKKLFKSASDPNEFVDAVLEVAGTTIADLHKSISGKATDLGKLLKDQSKHGISSASYIWGFFKAIITLFGIVCAAIMLARGCVPEALTCRTSWRGSDPQLLE